MAKRTLIDRPVEKNISIPLSIVERVNYYISDPLTNRPGHGAWSRLITECLLVWLERQKKPKGTPPGFEKPLDT